MTPPTETTVRYSRSAWHQDARFGMFIHWGAYAVPARGEWVRSVERISTEDYQQSVDAFQPTDWDPDAWAQLAADAGMTYAVLTAKHHDGFCLFDSALTEYSTMHNGLGRDLVAEFLAAFRARGIRVGLYFSLLDWARTDYPAFDDEHHPQRGDESVRDRVVDLPAYRDYLHRQVEELCTNYGALDLLWFDFSYGAMTGEAWGATELIQMVRRLQPDVLIDNRLEASGSGHGSLVTEHPTAFAGDFVSPEQIIPPSPIVDFAGDPVPWESCITLNNSWGYTADDHGWKSATTVIRALVECVSKGGNLLLNVGPDAAGTIPAESAAILREVGSWLRANGESIRGCGAADLPKPEFGRYTARGDTIYAHLLEQPIGPVPLAGIEAAAVGTVTLVADGSDIPHASAWVTESYAETTFVSLGPVPQYTYPLPDARDTVLRIDRAR